MAHNLLRFDGHIAGFGSTAGIRMVIGTWTQSPFGAFTDAMVQTGDGRRTLVAPSVEIGEFVSSTYHFDDVAVQPVTAEWSADALSVVAADVDVDVTIGGAGPYDRLLRLVPASLSRQPWWLRAIDPVAARLVPGVHTAGTAGNGRREFYGVRRSRLITAVRGRFGGVDLGALARLEPAVQFGFASAPATPQLVTVTTTITEPGSSRASGRGARRGR